MKTLYLISNRLRQYFVKNKLIFMLFIIGGVLNSLMFSYFYGNILSVVSERNSYSTSDKEYDLSLYGYNTNYDTDAIDISDIAPFSDNPLIEYICIGKYVDVNEDEHIALRASMSDRLPDVECLKGSIEFSSDTAH